MEACAPCPELRGPRLQRLLSDAELVFVGGAGGGDGGAAERGDLDAARKATLLGRRCPPPPPPPPPSSAPSSSSSSSWSSPSASSSSSSSSSSPLASASAEEEEAEEVPRPLERPPLPPPRWRNSTGLASCAAGRVLELLLCSQAALLRREPLAAFRELEHANALLPWAGPCLNDEMWPISAAEVLDNYRSSLRVLSNHLMPSEEEEKEKRGVSSHLFVKMFTEAEFAERVLREHEDLADELRWIPRSSRRSRAEDFERRASQTAAAPPALPKGAAEAGHLEQDPDRPCGLTSASSSSSSSSSPAPGAEEGQATASAWWSKARKLSESGCVWLLENVCIEDRNIVFFGSGEQAKQLPRALLGCGEFGSFEFTALKVRDPRARRRFPQNASVAETLIVVPAMMAAVSTENPFHVLHSTVPVAWQLHHPSYGLCVPRDRVDVRTAYISGFHAKRSAHFWRVVSRRGAERSDGSGLQKLLALISATRFWWSPLTDHPPKPLGADDEPRCYRRAIFGRELFRTGLGGFVTPRVLSFYRRYIDEAMKAAVAGAPRISPSPAEASQRSAFVRALGALGTEAWTEWLTYERMEPDAPRAPAGVDPMGLGEFASGRFRASGAFDPASARGREELEELPRRFWRSDLDNPELEVKVDPTRPPPTPDDVVRTQLVLSRDAASGGGRVVNVLLVQRPRSAGRWIANLGELLHWVEDFSHPSGARVRLLVTDFARIGPGTQWDLVSQANILVGVTGAALGWLPFMPQGGAVLDLFPPNSFFCNEGWGQNVVSHYGGLARLASIHHTCMVHPANTLGPAKPGESVLDHARREVNELLGGYWHGQSILVDIPKFARYFSEAIDRVLSSAAPDEAGAGAGAGAGARARGREL